MSTSINQIIEVYKDGKWQYVPLANTFSQENNTLQKCGSIRDLFAYKWHGADKYMQSGVPEDISKLAREAMIYDDQDYITSGSCWISAAQIEALADTLRQNYANIVDKLIAARKKNDITDRLDKIENALAVHIFGKTNNEIKKDMGVEEDGYDEDEEYIQEELEEAMWAWVNLERNWAEIEAYVSYFTNDDYRMSDIRVIMFVS